MRGLALFLGGLLLGSAVQTGIAQGDNDNIVGVNHVGIAVEDFDAAVKFYTEGMGFREAFIVNDANGEPTQAYIQVSRGTFLEIRPARPDRPAGVINHVGLGVDDIRARSPVWNGTVSGSTSKGRARESTAPSSPTPSAQAAFGWS